MQDLTSPLYPTGQPSGFYGAIYKQKLHYAHIEAITNMVNAAKSLFQRVPHPEHLSWARIVSDIVSPPVVWAVLAIPVALQYSQTTVNALFWAALYSIFICLIPISYVAYHVWRGNISDIHMKERRQRIRPLLVSILSTATVWWLLKRLDAPSAFPLLAILSLVQISLIAMITMMWQISMHMMSIAGAVLAIGVIFGVGAALLLVPLVALVAAARLHLQRHTPAQIIAGTVLGALVPVIVLGTIPMSIFHQAL